VRLCLDCPASMLSGQLSCCLQHLSVSSDDPRSEKFIAMLPDPHHFVPANKASTFIVWQLHEYQKKGMYRNTPLAKKGLHRDTPLAVH
jgi:hypothetical protein